MFKHVVVAFLFCLTSTIANAQSESYFSSQKQVLCDDTKKVISSLTQTWGEQPVWTAKDGQNDSRYLLLVNPRTRTWTFLQYTPEVACILGLGEASTFANSNKSSI